MLSTKSQAGTPEWTAPGACCGRCGPCCGRGQLDPTVRGAAPACQRSLPGPRLAPAHPRPAPAPHPPCTAEVLRSQPYNEKCDIYSYGVILWEVSARC